MHVSGMCVPSLTVAQVPFLTAMCDVSKDSVARQKIRKLVYGNLSGAEKARKKREADQSVRKQFGALNRYLR
jgi:hypothetical protein